MVVVFDMSCISVACSSFARLPTETTECSGVLQNTQNYLFFVCFFFNHLFVRWLARLGLSIVPRMLMRWGFFLSEWNLYFRFVSIQSIIYWKWNHFLPKTETKNEGDRNGLHDFHFVFAFVRVSFDFSAIQTCMQITLTRNRTSSTRFLCHSMNLIRHEIRVGNVISVVETSYDSNLCRYLLSTFLEPSIFWGGHLLWECLLDDNETDGFCLVPVGPLRLDDELIWWRRSCMASIASYFGLDVGRPHGYDIGTRWTWRTTIESMGWRGTRFEKSESGH